MNRTKAGSSARLLMGVGALMLVAACVCFAGILTIKWEKFVEGFQPEKKLQAAVHFSGMIAIAGGTVLYLGLRESRNPTPTNIPQAVYEAETWDPSQSPVFDAAGVQFRLAPVPADRAFMVWVEFLNRYQELANFGIRLTAPGGIHREILIKCPGGARGVARFAMAIPKAQQGNVISFQLAALTQYPDGKGTWLRPRTGLALGPPEDPLDAWALKLGRLMFPTKVLQPTLYWLVPVGMNEVVHEGDIQTEIVKATDA